MSFQLRTIILTLAAALTLSAAGQTRVIAHRGYWKAEGSAQNSITSLKRANAIGIYGTEFDVQLTADHRMVVNHDEHIQGLVIAQTSYARLKHLRLANGERLSTLEQYLKAGRRCPHLQLVLEVKPHEGKETEDMLVRLVVAMVKKYRMEQQTHYISFSLNVCEQLARLAPQASVSYLEGDLSPHELKARGINGIDYHYKVLQDHPDWVGQAHDLGMTVNVWTVNDLAVARQMRDLKVDFITTDQPEEVAALMSSHEP